jgi:hypothetical protein
MASDIPAGPSFKPATLNDSSTNSRTAVSSFARAARALALSRDKGFAVASFGAGGRGALAEDLLPIHAAPPTDAQRMSERNVIFVRWLISFPPYGLSHRRALR